MSDIQPPTSTNAGNPWERRAQLGFGTGLIETVKLFITRPTEAFAQTRERGDFASPLIFGVLVAWAAAIVGEVWRMIFGTSMLAMFGGSHLGEQLAPLMAMTGVGLVIQIIFAPIFIFIALFIWSGILHLSVLIVGGAKSSTSGFEGTFRTVSYSAVAQLGQIIPFVGGLIAFVWGIVLLVIGLVRMHHTSQGRAITAVLLPIVLCCVLVGLIISMGVAAAIFAGANSH